MPSRTQPVAMVALVVAASLAACAAGEDVSPTPAPTPPPSSTPPADEAELAATGQALPAGRYTRAGFAPRISLELDSSWQAVQLAAGFIDVQQDVGRPDVIAVQFARPSAIFGADGASEPTPSAEAAVELIGANQGLTVLESSESRIGGLTGSQVTVENAGDAHARVMQVPPGALGIDPGRRLWIAFIDTPDGLLAIMVGGSVAMWDEALDAAEPVLESIRIGE